MKTVRKKKQFERRTQTDRRRQEKSSGGQIETTTDHINLARINDKCPTTV